MPQRSLSPGASTDNVGFQKFCNFIFGGKMCLITVELVLIPDLVCTNHYA